MQRRWQPVLGCVVLSMMMAAPAWGQASRNDPSRQEARQAREELVRGLNEIDQQRDAAIRDARDDAERRPNVFEERRQEIVQRFAQQRERLLDRYEQQLLGASSGASQVYGMNEPPESDREGRQVWLRQQLARVNGQIAEENELHAQRTEQLQELQAGGRSDAVARVRTLVQNENERHQRAMRPLEDRRQELRQRLNQSRQELGNGAGNDGGNPTRMNQLLDALEREINAGS